MIERFGAAEQLRGIVENPLWYKDFRGFERRMMLGALAVAAPRMLAGATSLEQVAQTTRRKLYAAFEQLLAEQVVALGTGHQWDDERQPIDTIVLHHTGSQPGITAERLNAMHLLRLYVPVYANPSPANELTGTEPISSGHNRDGQDIFWAYHWLVRSDGQAERLLEDHEIGWQAGNWGVNCRSIAICIDDDLTDHAPDGAVLEGVAQVIRDNYSQLTINPETVLGHGEIVATECPGVDFVGGWKVKLLDKLSA